MPKSKPDQVIVHRIELQEKERELLEPFIKAKEVEQYGKTVGVVVGAAALGGAAYAVWWTLDSLYGWLGTAREKTDELLQKVKEHDEQNDSNLEDKMKATSPLMRVWLWANS